MFLNHGYLLPLVQILMLEKFKGLSFNRDLSLEFWLKNQVTATNAQLISQNEGINVRLSNNQLTFVLGSETISAPIQSDGQFHHYALSYEAATGVMRIIENDTILEEQNVTQNLNFK